MDDFMTWGDLKAGNIGSEIGMCSDSPKLLFEVNRAIRRLMIRGDWSKTIVPVHMCVRGGCVTWPRFVGQVRRLKLCGRPVQMANVYSQFLDRDLWPCWFTLPSLGYWKGYYSGCRDWSYFRANQLGFYSTYADPQGVRYIRAYPQFSEDIGKTVTIFGKDENHLPLIHTDADGNVIPGAVITLANPYGSTSITVQAPIERVIKDVTQGQVWLYAYNPDTDELEDLAVYAGSETNPSYERTQIPGCPDKTTGATALVKLKHIDLVNDSDLCLIPSFDAIAFMLKARLFDRNEDSDNANKFEAKAIRELNLKLRDDMPEAQTAVSVEPFNATGIGPQQVF